MTRIGCKAPRSHERIGAPKPAFRRQTTSRGSSLSHAFFRMYFRFSPRNFKSGGMRAAAGGTIFLDVPHANQDALALARQHLDAPVFETARVYRRGRPPDDVSRVFGITTFELG